METDSSDRVAQYLDRPEVQGLSSALGSALQDLLSIWEMLESLLHAGPLCVCVVHVTVFRWHSGGLVWLWWLQL